MTIKHCLLPAPDSIPPLILASTDALVAKTAFLAGMVAPETAACLSRLLMASDAGYSRIIDGHHTVPEVLKDSRNFESQQSTRGSITELRRRIVAALDHHHRLLQVQPPPDGDGVVARRIVRLHFAQLGLHPQLWSLARGLARRHEEYHAAFAMTDRTREREFDHGIQLSGKTSLTFIEFMLDVCHEEVDYMTAAMTRHKLREAVLHALRTNSRLQKTGVRPEAAPAFLALLIQGALPRAEFEVFTGLQPEEAHDQVARLINIGLVVSPSSNACTLEVGIPVWFAENILPDLHQRLIRSHIHNRSL
ncbi:hypothetical protein [Pseudomonas akapageensis]|uniref:hypothetical protein n=1 Tax=Pseudomonas akapageensis TaxID=2609961 RepID=UPI001407BDA1|nr:hypothetical protein [Pseudomonas akapageensis]